MKKKKEMGNLNLAKLNKWEDSKDFLDLGIKHMTLN